MEDINRWRWQMTDMDGASNRKDNWSNKTLLRRIYDKLFHVSDWFPTILQLASGMDKFIFEGIDGINQYESIFQDNSGLNPRTLVINELSDGFFGTFRGAFQNAEGFKLLRNPTNQPIARYYLFNVKTDPNETTDLKHDYPELFEQMKSQMEASQIISFSEI